jgi:hypothetical protein
MNKYYIVSWLSEFASLSSMLYTGRAARISKDVLVIVAFPVPKMLVKGASESECGDS